MGFLFLYFLPPILLSRMMFAVFLLPASGVHACPFSLLCNFQPLYASDNFYLFLWLPPSGDLLLVVCALWAGWPCPSLFPRVFFSSIAKFNCFFVFLSFRFSFKSLSFFLFFPQVRLTLPPFVFVVAPTDLFWVGFFPLGFREFFSPPRMCSILIASGASPRSCFSFHS